jgi:hypothetical protein
VLTFKSFIKENAGDSNMDKPFNPLSIGDLRKDENRVLTFINKVRDGETFATVKVGEVTIYKQQLDDITKFMNADGKFPANRTVMMVDTSKGKLKIPNDFLKTGDFGGKGAGSGTSKEAIALKLFNDNLNTILQKQGLSQIKLRINRRVVDCAIMEKTTGNYNGKDPKSDMTIKDINGKPVAYISHKAGSSAKDYQQYGGVSDLALPTAYRGNAFIKKFMQDVNVLRPDGLKSGDSFYRTVTDPKLVKIMMYGPQFGSSASINNVDEFHLGNMSLKGSGDGPYEIISNHKGSNGDMPKGQFEAVLFIRFQDRRGDARAGGEVVKNARVGIFPIAKISSTTKKI